MWSVTGVLRTRRVKEWVFFEVQVMGFTLPVRIPERLVPDQFEGKLVKLDGRIGLDKNGKVCLITEAIIEDVEGE